MTISSVLLMPHFPTLNLINWDFQCAPQQRPPLPVPQAGLGHLLPGPFEQPPKWVSCFTKPSTAALAE